MLTSSGHADCSCIGPSFDELCIVVLCDIQAELLHSQVWYATHMLLLQFMLEFARM